MATDLETILASIFERTRHQRRNPATSPVQSLGLNSELPIGITSVTAPFLAEPIYGFYLTADPVVDHFENDTNADVNLSAHTADSTHTWTARANQLDLKTEDYVLENGGGLALYTISGRSTADMIVSCVYQDVNVVANGGGLLFRYQDTTNYWRVRVLNSTTYRLEEVIAGTGQADLDVVSTDKPANGDSIMVICIGDTILFYINNRLEGSVISANQNDEVNCGVYIDNTNATKLGEFRAAEITSVGFNFETAVRSHTFFGGPEEYVYLLEGSQTEKELDLVVLDRFRPPANADEDIGNHLADTGHVWTKRQGGFTVLTSGVCTWDGGTTGIVTVDAGTPKMQLGALGSNITVTLVNAKHAKINGITSTHPSKEYISGDVTR